MHTRFRMLLVTVVVLLLATVAGLPVRAQRQLPQFLPLLYAHTPQATHTPTPTATATATSTPGSTPTAEVPAAVTVLDTWSRFIDSIDSLHVVGEVKNTTGENVQFVKVTVNLFDTQGHLLDTDFTYTSEDVIEPNQQSCFEAIFLDSPPLQDIASVEFEVSFRSGGRKAPGLVLLGVSGAYSPTFEDWYEVIGQVRNDGPTKAEYVKVTSTLYSGPNQTGQVLDCGFTYVNATHLEPGQTSSFKVLHTSVPSGTVGSYKVSVEGDSP